MIDDIISGGISRLIFNEKTLKFLKKKFAKYYNKNKKIKLEGEVSDEEIEILKVIFSNEINKGNNEDFFKPELKLNTDSDLIKYLTSEKKYLKKLRERLSDHYYRLSYYCTIINHLYEVKNIGMAKRIQDDFNSKYGEDGKRYYNLFSNGYVDFYISVIKSKEDVLKTIKESLEDLPFAIFVNKKKRKRILVKEIESKLKELGMVRLHGSQKEVIKTIRESTDIVVNKNSNLLILERQHSNRIMVNITNEDSSNSKK